MCNGKGDMMNRKGFSLVEIMISLLVFSIVIAAVFTLFFNSNNAKKTAENLANMQQTGRNAIEFITRDLRAAGYGVDLSGGSLGGGQPVIAYADPYTVVFNANIAPSNDDPAAPSAPLAYNPAKTSNDTIPISVFYYFPTEFFQTGAETYVYTIDTVTGNSPAENTLPTTDVAIARLEYGYDPSEDDNLRRIDYVGIINMDTLNPQPLFMYWYDDDGDPTTPDVLWGDSDNSGDLSSTEIAALTPVSSGNLNSVNKITVNLNLIAPERTNDEFLTSNVVTTVGLNRNSGLNTYPVILHVYEDENENHNYDGTSESGISGILITLAQGGMATTDVNGIAYFEVTPGEYDAILNYPVDWMPTTATERHFIVLADSLNLSADSCFGMKQWPVAQVKGCVWNDINRNGIYEPDSGETVLEGITIIGTDVPNVKTDVNGEFSGAVKAYFDKTISLELPDTLGITGSYIDLAANPPVNLADSSTSEDHAITVNLEEDGYVYLWFGVSKTVGVPCWVNLTKPDSFEVLRQGDYYEVRWVGSGVDDDLVSGRLYYSFDAGATWQQITYISYPADTGFTYWDINSIYKPSRTARLKMTVVDEGGNTASSIVPIILTPKNGFTELYFERISPEDTVFIPLPSSWDTFKVNEGLSATLYGTTHDIYPKLLSPVLPLDTFTGVSFARCPDWNGSSYHGPMRQGADPDAPAEWITNKWVPSADTVYQGKWVFVFAAMSSDSVTNPSSYYSRHDVVVSKRDSTGDANTDTIIFDTRSKFNVDSLMWLSMVTDPKHPETLVVWTSSPTPIDVTNRLYIKLFLESYAEGFSSGYPADSYDVQVLFNPWIEEFKSMVILPDSEEILTP